jgi:hypothetical protein
VQCTGLVGANEKRVPLDDPVDSVIRVVFGGSGPDPPLDTSCRAARQRSKSAAKEEAHRS